MGKKLQAIFDTDWSDLTRSVPEGVFFEKYVKTLDSQGFDAVKSSHHPTKYSYRKSDGSEYSGGDSGFNQLKQDYGVFTEWCHEPRWVSMAESINVDGATEVVGTAMLHYNLVGPEDGHPRVTDRQGKQWDGATPGTFHLWLEKAEGGDDLVVIRTEVYSDSGPVAIRLLQRGVIKPADLGL